MAQHQMQHTTVQVANVNENGEQILVEGVCDRRGLFTNVFWIIVIAMASLIAIPIGLIIACIAIGCNKWRLYLTPGAIHYQHWGTCFLPSTDVIPLSYIQEATAINTDKSVYLKMERERAYEFISWDDRPCIWSCYPPESCFYIIKHVTNYEEFTEAVKRQIAAR